MTVEMNEDQLDVQSESIESSIDEVEEVAVEIIDAPPAISDEAAGESSESIEASEEVAAGEEAASEEVEATEEIAAAKKQKPLKKLLPVKKLKRLKKKLMLTMLMTPSKPVMTKLTMMEATMLMMILKLQTNLLLLLSSCSDLISGLLLFYCLIECCRRLV